MRWALPRLRRLPPRQKLSLCAALCMIAGCRPPLPPGELDGTLGSGAAQAADNTLPGGDLPVFQVNGREITGAEAQERLFLASQLAAPTLAVPTNFKTVIDGLIEIEVLAQAATHNGWVLGPEEVLLTQLAEADSMLRTTVAHAAPVSSLTEAEVAAYYEAHRAEFVRPAMVSVRTLTLATHEDAREAGVELRRRLATTSMPRQEIFEQLIAERSADPDEKARAGDTGLFAAPGPGCITDPDLWEAISKLPRIDEVAGSRRTGRGWTFYFLERRIAAVDIPLEQAADLIRERVARQRGAQAGARAVAAARQAVGVQVDAQAVAALTRSHAATGVASNAVRPRRYEADGIAHAPSVIAGYEAARAAAAAADDPMNNPHASSAVEALLTPPAPMGSGEHP